MKIKSKEKNSEVVIALPADNAHRDLVKAVYPSLEKLGIEVLFVDENGSVKPFHT